MGSWDAPADEWQYLHLVDKLALVWNCLFSLLALAGTLLVNRVKNEAAFPFTVALLVFPLLFYATHTDERYRQPIDPIMCLLAVFAVDYVLAYLTKRASALHRAAQSAPGLG